MPCQRCHCDKFSKPSKIISHQLVESFFMGTVQIMQINPTGLTSLIIRRAKKE